MIDLAHTLPRPGSVWGRSPMRPARETAPPWRPFGARAGRGERERIAAGSVVHANRWHPMSGAARAGALQALRLQLLRDGLQHDSLARALGYASACAEATLGWRPRHEQCLAAVVLLDQRMAEMATGEGKTLAIGLAAAVGALAGMPVHVVTANDYLAVRDAALLAPLFSALGLGVAARPGAADDAARRRVYAHDIVYATARDLAFDFLRDQQALGGAGVHEQLAAGVVADPAAAAPAAPLLRGLCLALLDEADSLLLDDAELPLVLSRAAPHAARRAFLWQALALARRLVAGRDFIVLPAERSATLTAAGEASVAGFAAALGGPWLRPRYRREAVVVALTGLHACRRDEHYVVREGRIDLLDEVSGRIAEGRVWSRGLHTVVALKEGVGAPPETDTVAQTTFQRFFQRYWRLGGISGTLWEARHELGSVYGTPVERIPLHQPCRRRSLPPRVFVDEAARLAALVPHVAALQAAGRPVLVGTDSVAASQRVAEALAAHGVAHRVLNALQDADEAAIVALAGCAGRVTVATRMAGRGTDIGLDAAARAAGGLHVLSCQINPSHRLDRQLAGRAGRAGDPGSAEVWLLRDLLPYRFERSPSRLEEWTDSPSPVPRANGCFARWLSLRRRLQQARDDRRRAAMRQTLLNQDREWEQRLSFAGPPR